MNHELYFVEVVDHYICSFSQFSGILEAFFGDTEHFNYCLLNSNRNEMMYLETTQKKHSSSDSIQTTKVHKEIKTDSRL